MEFGRRSAAPTLAPDGLLPSMPSTACAIHKLDSANSISRCAVPFCSPQKRTFTKPNWRMMTPKRVLDLRVHAGLAMLFLMRARLGSSLGQLGDVAGARGDSVFEQP